jgi:hypothetical protein
MESGEEFPRERILTMIATNEIEITEALDATETTPARKPISEAKLLANRRNGALSHGPSTDAGRRRSSLNGYRNGLNGQIVCSAPEELAAFKSFCSEIQTELAPVGPSKGFTHTLYDVESKRNPNGLSAIGANSPSERTCGRTNLVQIPPDRQEVAGVSGP